MRFLEKLKHNWQGPPVDIVVKDKTHTLGQGTAATKLTVHNPKFFARLALSPSLAFGEAYMNGDLEVQGDLMHVLEGFHTSKFRHKLHLNLPISRSKAVKNAQHHYDIGNDFYALWLDEGRVYSCAYFLSEDDDIDTAQQQKLELLCRKARLQAGNALLDIGCGWGALMFHAVKHHGVTATGITPANEQADFIEQRAKQEGLEDKIKVIRGDWRQLEGQFDRIISVGMFEHVGLKQYPAFFKTWRSLLKDDGISLLHTIGRMAPGQGTDPWINKYIFPGGFLPSPDEMSRPIANQGMTIADTENLWQHYDLTLQRWLTRFEANKDKITDMFDEKFVRMWRLYLMGSISSFRWGKIHLWQLVILPGKQSSWPLNREVNAQALLSRN